MRDIRHDPGGNRAAERQVLIDRLPPRLRARVADGGMSLSAALKIADGVKREPHPALAFLSDKGTADHTDGIGGWNRRLALAYPDSSLEERMKMMREAYREYIEGTRWGTGRPRLAPDLPAPIHLVPPTD